VFEEDQQNESAFDVLLLIDVHNDVLFLGRATMVFIRLKIDI
jgi:hypothetical protein